MQMNIEYENNLSQMENVSKWRKWVYEADARKLSNDHTIANIQSYSQSISSFILILFYYCTDAAYWGLCMIRCGYSGCLLIEGLCLSKRTAYQQNKSKWCKWKYRSRSILSFSKLLCDAYISFHYSFMSIFERIIRRFLSLSVSYFVSIHLCSIFDRCCGIHHQLILCDCIWHLIELQTLLLLKW